MNPATKINVDSHFIIRHFRRSFNLVIQIYDSYKYIPYSIYYKSDGRIMTISYTGPEFGIRELRECQTKNESIKRKYGGNGTGIILDAVDKGIVEYKYENGINVWSVKGDFKVFEYEQKMPEDLLALELGNFYKRIEDDPVFEIFANIYAHHNVIYPKNTTLFILKCFIVKYIPYELPRFIRLKKHGINYRKAQKQKVKAKKLTGPDIVIPKYYRRIRQGAFEDREDIVNVVIPEGITGIDRNAFENCINLENIKIPESVTDISAFVFEGCKNLTHIELPQKVNTLYNGIFERCERLREVVLPKYLQRLYGAFRDCKSLREIHIPAGVKEITSDAFRGCLALENIYVDPESTEYSDVDGVLMSKDKKTLAHYPKGRKRHKYRLKKFIRTEMRFIPRKSSKMKRIQRICNVYCSL